MWGARVVAAAAAAAQSGAVLTPGTAVCRQQQQQHPLGGARFLPRCRALHCSAGLGGSRNLLKKFISKNKRKFWYDSPTLGSHLVYKPTNVSSVLKLHPSKVKKEDSIRKRALNVLLYKAVRDVLNTCEAGQEAYDLNVELSKVSLTSDFSTCRVYWNSTSNAEQDDYIDKVLRQSAPRIRHLLITHQILGTVPPIVFVKDKADAAVREIECLLASVELGPLEEENELTQNDFSKPNSTMTVTGLDTPDSCIHSNLFGIDHEALTMQITEYKKRKKDKEIKGIELSEQQQKQLAEIRKQTKMKRKKAKKLSDNDITPQKYLMDKYSGDYWDSETISSQENELEGELQEIENHVEVDTRGGKKKNIYHET